MIDRIRAAVAATTQHKDRPTRRLVRCAALLKRIHMALLLVMTLAAGCDSSGPEFEASPTGPLSLDLAELVGKTESCRTIVSSVTLYADGQLVGSSPIDLDGQAVFEPLQLIPGIVAFEAQVFGNAGPMVFLARQNLPVQSDGFQVEIRPFAVSPVMEVCIPADEQSLIINNRGIDAVDWEIKVKPGFACPIENPECLDFEQMSGSTLTNSTVPYAVNTVEPRTFELVVESPEGSLELRIFSAEGSSAARKMQFVSQTTEVQL